MRVISSFFKFSRHRVKSRGNCNSPQCFPSSPLRDQRTVFKSFRFSKTAKNDFCNWHSPLKIQVFKYDVNIKALVALKYSSRNTILTPEGNFNQSGRSFYLSAAPGDPLNGRFKGCRYLHHTFPRLHHCFPRIKGPLNCGRQLTRQFMGVFKF